MPRPGRVQPGAQRRAVLDEFPEFPGWGGIGGGLDYWFNKKMALRTEAQIQALGIEESLVVFRVGFAFR